MAKDDTNPSSASEDTVSAVGNAEAGQVESPETGSTEGEHKARRAAPHLRVVGEDEEFVAHIETPPAAELTSDLPHQRIGALLRARRENLGYSLDQVSKETRVHLSHLRAIEEMTPGLLGAPVYAKGYIRAYARHLGLDEMSTLDRYLSECAILKDPEKQDIAPPTTGRKLPTALPVLGFLIVALAGAAGAFFFMNGEKTSSTTTAGPAPAEATPAAPPAAAATDTTVATAPVQQLRVVALRSSPLDIRSANGTKMFSRPLERGESFIVRVGAGWTVSALEDGSAFEWRLGDQSLGLLSDTAIPVYSQSVDIAAQRPPIVVETPPPEATPPAPDATAAASPPAARTTTATPPGATGAAPAPPKPRTPRPPRPEPQANAPVQPPVTSATPPVAPPPAPAQTTPARDPALAAYPDQQPAQPPSRQ